MNTWSKCKEKINQLPANYDGVIEGLSKSQPQNIKKRMSLKAYLVECKLEPIEGHEIFLQVVKGGNETQRAQYIAYNYPENSCFVRDLLNMDAEFKLAQIL